MIDDGWHLTPLENSFSLPPQILRGNKDERTQFARDIGHTLRKLGKRKDSEKLSRTLKEA
jgi:hypothetical protein